jgi:hypothetical protein
VVSELPEFSVHRALQEINLKVNELMWTSQSVMGKEGRPSGVQVLSAGHGWGNIFRDVTMMVSWRPSGVQVLRAGHGWWTIFRDVTMMVSWRDIRKWSHIVHMRLC